MIYSDNVVLWANYRLSVLIHIQFFLVLSFVQLLGDPIDCSIELIDKKIVDSYCWTVGTWTLDYNDVIMDNDDVTTPLQLDPQRNQLYSPGGASENAYLKPAKIYHRY